MSQTNPNPDRERLDAATSQRLARLATLPVDTRRLEAMLKQQVPSLAPQPNRSHPILSFIRPMRAVAASVAALFVISAVLFYMSASPVSASPQHMAQLHEDVVSGRTPVMKVDSIEAAGESLSQQWPGSPELPGVPQEHVMACCMKSVHNRKVAVVLLQGHSGGPVTMTVAKASDMKAPKGPKVEHDGFTYHTESSGKLNMVSTERDGRYVCLIGSLPTEELMDLASELRF